MIFLFRMAIRHHRHVQFVLLLGRLIYRTERRVDAGDASDHSISEMAEW